MCIALYKNPLLTCFEYWFCGKSFQACVAEYVEQSVILNLGILGF